jgi:hypothetical protein
LNPVPLNRYGACPAANPGGYESVFNALCRGLRSTRRRAAGKSDNFLSMQSTGHRKKQSACKISKGFTAILQAEKFSYG